MIKTDKRILLLVVEDEKVLVDTMEEKLVSEGFSVIKAYNGLEGLSLAKNQHPDLILLDLLLPKMDGMSMLRELRKDIWGKSVPVFILTNIPSSNEERLKDVLELEPTYYFEKVNKNLSEIVEKIKEELEVNS